MERFEKLKLLRGLYCLTQEEMAVLANNCSRSFYSAAEVMKKDDEDRKTSRRKLPVAQSTALRESLRFEDEWFNGDIKPPLQGYRFAFIDMDWSKRHLGVNASVRCRRINDAERAVKEYLPVMLAENEPVRSFIGSTDSGREMAFFLFDQQGLLLRTIPGLPITGIIREVIAAAAPKAQLLALSDEAFDQISSQSAKEMLSFLKRCNIDEETVRLMQPEIEGLSERQFDYSTVFGNAVRETTLKNICQEIFSNGFTLDDVAKAMNNLQQNTSNQQK